jgi:DNA processing protein
MLAPRIDSEEELHWLALRLVPGLGTRRSGQLIKQFGAAEAVFRASVSELTAARIPGAVARTITSGCTFEEAALQHQKMLESGVTLVPIRDPRYPPLLREIHDPPIVLFARGRVELLQTLILGVVGTRRPTPYGAAVAARLSEDLARARLTIASGMARGIDTAAHRATLGTAGKTIAVFGCGVDRVYPAENRKLATQISEEGLLLSEFPMGTPAQPQNFPVRNRIISGMSAGVLVIEGAQYSGSSITARLAMEQDRLVFAVPGNVTSKLSWGPNLLIKQGAKLVQEWQDVLEELQPEQRQLLIEQSAQALASGASVADEGNGQPALPQGAQGQVSRDILELLPVDSATPIDEILEKLDQYSSSELIAALFELEMLGLIRQLPGKNFVKVW